MHFANLLDALAPMHCAACDRAGSPLCHTCIRDIERLPQPHPPDACAAFPYAGPVRAVLHRGKFRDARSALRILADVAAVRLDPPPNAHAVAVPLSRWRHRERGYNQAQLVATVIAGHHEVAVRRWLTRVRETQPQSSLGRDQRAGNVAGAFAAAEAVRGRCVWIIDDVRTTGATTTAARDCLLAAGAASVDVAVLANVP